MTRWSGAGLYCVFVAVTSTNLVVLPDTGHALVPQQNKGSSGDDHDVSGKVGANDKKCSEKEGCDTSRFTGTGGPGAPDPLAEKPADGKACPDVYKPVCNTKTMRTYKNRCEAREAGTKKKDLAEAEVCVLAPSTMDLSGEAEELKGKAPPPEAAGKAPPLGVEQEQEEASERRSLRQTGGNVVQCCKQATAECLSCASGTDQAEYCGAHPQTPGCPRSSSTPTATVTVHGDLHRCVEGEWGCARKVHDDFGIGVINIPASGRMRCQHNPVINVYFPNPRHAEVQEHIPSFTGWPLIAFAPGVAENNLHERYYGGKGEKSEIQAEEGNGGPTVRSNLGDERNFIPTLLKKGFAVCVSLSGGDSYYWPTDNWHINTVQSVIGYGDCHHGTFADDQLACANLLKEEWLQRKLRDEFGIDMGHSPATVNGNKVKGGGGRDLTVSASSVNEEAHKVDFERVGLMGYSTGARATVENVGDKNRITANKVKAAVAMAPWFEQSGDWYYLMDTEYPDKVEAPMLWGQAEDDPRAKPWHIREAFQTMHKQSWMDWLNDPVRELLPTQFMLPLSAPQAHWPFFNIENDRQAGPQNKLVGPHIGKIIAHWFSCYLHNSQNLLQTTHAAQLFQKSQQSCQRFQKQPYSGEMGWTGQTGKRLQAGERVGLANLPGGAVCKQTWIADNRWCGAIGPDVDPDWEVERLDRFSQSTSRNAMLDSARQAEIPRVQAKLTNLSESEVPKCEGCSSNWWEGWDADTNCWSTCGGGTEWSWSQWRWVETSGDGWCNKCNSRNGKRGACCRLDDNGKTYHSGSSAECRDTPPSNFGARFGYHTCVIVPDA